MGHIAHLRKQFKSINTYDYIITMIRGRKKKHYYLNAVCEVLVILIRTRALVNKRPMGHIAHLRKQFI